ncbi:MAG: hypothetical protein WC736_15510 [Gallionella sp.]
MSEKDVQSAILQYLAKAQIWCRRYHPQPLRGRTGRVIVPIRRPDGKPDKGHPDIVAKTKNATINIECKAIDGKQSAEQKAWQAEAEARGEIYILAYDVQDVMRLFERPEA